MDKLKKLLELEEQTSSKKVFFGLAVIAFIFALAVRFYWVDYHSGIETSTWNDQVMINTNDGYYWAEGTRDILREQKFYSDSPVSSPISRLTALIVQMTPFSIETIILYMPGVLGALLVIPVMLIGRTFQQNYLGFAAGMFASIVWSYYNRTMFGYYDTDMLVVVLPTFIIFGFVLAMQTENTKNLWLAPFFAALAIEWHTSGTQLANAILITFVAYIAVFKRKEIFYYKLLMVYALALITLALVFKLALIFAVAGVLHIFREKLIKKYVLLIGLLVLITYIIFGGFSWFVTVLNDAYITRALFADTQPVTLKFFNVVNTVREAGNIPFEIFANRIAGNSLIFIMSLIGYGLMLIRYPVMLISLPLVGLGLFAYIGGLRFTVFAVPFTTLGLFFIIWHIGEFLKNLAGSRSVIKHLSVALLTVGMLYPNINHVVDYKTPTVFTRDEIKVLDQLQKVATRQDYVVSWWDYGYPIRFYSDVNTLVDGGKHGGSSNFPVSYALTFPQLESARMARLDVEYDVVATEKKQWSPLLKQMMSDYGYIDSNLFLNDLKGGGIAIPEKSRDVYYYLPLRMLNIYQTVRLFSNLDLTTGKQYAGPFLYVSNSFKDTGEKILLGNGIQIDKRTSSVRMGNQQIPLSSLLVTVYDQYGKLHVKNQGISPVRGLVAVYMKSYNKFLLMDQETLNSTYMQLFVFENYDKNLFEPVILTPLAKVYRLKI